MSRGWVGSDRRSRLPDNWPQIRKIVLDRDNHQCQWRDKPGGPRCLAPANQVDHIKAKTDDHRPEALQALCESHHKTKSAKEGAAAFHAARRARRARMQRTPAPHPGAIRPGEQPVPYPWKLAHRRRAQRAHPEGAPMIGDRSGEC